MGRDSVRPNYRVVVLGSASVGKSSIISKFMHDRFLQSHKETIEELHIHVMRCDNVSVEIDILDTSGSYQFPAMRKLAIATGDAFVLVYSVDNMSSFETVKMLRDEIREQKTKGKYSIVVVANKVDLEPFKDTTCAVTESIVCIDWEEKFVFASAKTGENVHEVFRALENKIIERIKLEEKRLNFIRRISMPVMRIAKSEKSTVGLIQTKSRAHSMDS
ncbi:ras-related protein Rap-2c-like [Dreissena polymorpha]|uniref:GTP-binding protein Rhes n=1 Tax=Dreissena polymorpha TaxID=45954 RepID=A0A9D4M8Z3_DREPO|nr:ras-related protein Rap-2c-like [Dreissena polymorpha]KAH3871419.1 hypothetical protein DPMN_034619 [Dreissena polymorpha]